MDIKSWIGGCFGGFAGILTSYPFDTIKVRIQNQKASSRQYKSAIDCFTKTLRKESVCFYTFLFNFNFSTKKNTYFNPIDLRTVQRR
jgi:hypothetical protein